VLAGLPVLEFDLIELGTGGEHYLMDSRLGIVVVLDESFRFRRHFGGRGSRPGRFHTPSDMAFDAKSQGLFIADTGNSRVQVLRPDGSFVLSIGRRGSGHAEFVRPFGVATTESGFLYVTDMATHRVQKFRSQGRYLAEWGRGEKKTTPIDRLDPSLLYKPAGIATSHLGRDVMTVDWGHHRAQLHVGERVTDEAGAGEPPRLAPAEFRLFGSRAYLRRRR